MAIQYSASPFSVVSTTFPADTRALVVTGLKAALAAAGWTQLASGGAADFTMQTAVTPNGSLTCAVRVFDPGSGNCAVCRLRNVSGTLAQGGGCYLLPGAGKVYRVIASKYQFCCFTPGSTQAREFVMGGVPWIPAWLTPATPDWGWLTCNAMNDSDTTVRNTFRTSPFTTARNGGNLACMCDSYFWETNSYGDPSYFPDGAIKLVVPWKTRVAATNNVTGGWRWHGDIPLVSEPLLHWGLGSQFDDGRVRGQIWDAIYVHDAYNADTLITLDGRTWWAITHQNIGAESNWPRGTLFLAAG